MDELCTWYRTGSLVYSLVPVLASVVRCRYQAGIEACAGAVLVDSTGIRFRYWYRYLVRYIGVRYNELAQENNIYTSNLIQSVYDARARALERSSGDKARGRTRKTDVCASPWDP